MVPTQVQYCITGPTGSGKTAFLNACVGRPLFPSFPDVGQQSKPATEVHDGLDERLRLRPDMTHVNVSWRSKVAASSDNLTTTRIAVTEVSMIGARQAECQMPIGTTALILTSSSEASSSNARSVLVSEVPLARLQAYLTPRTDRRVVVVCVFTEEDVKQATSRRDLGHGALDGVLPDFVVINRMKNVSVGSPADVAVRASDLIGIAREHCCVLDLRQALAGRFAPLPNTGDEPNPWVAEADLLETFVNNMSRTALEEPNEERNSKPRHRVETAALVDDSKYDPCAAVMSRRYVPQALRLPTSSEATTSTYMPACCSPSSSTVSPDRYTLAVQSSPAIAGQLLCDLRAYVPKGVRSAAC